ncbi:MAG: carbonic anhydrase [Candidatus Dormibacteria bacterium]|jgi:carbonic anhydrase
MSVIQDILDESYVLADRFDARLGSLHHMPARHLAVVGCMDGRLDLPGILGLQPGDAHVIRNAGGVATDDVIRSLVVSQRLLGTREVMLVHHTGCGMLTFKDDELKAQIERETGVRPPFALEAFSDLDADLRQSINRIRLCPYLPYRDEVRGFVYDLHSGRLREVYAGIAADS